ncbi:MAG: ABC-F family ATP-binding cassette domain-containing protein [Clostridia bacterium]|nr:ABC-F family ATP-binding cassette domain-containing protein [Clostridia bacterium]
MSILEIKNLTQFYDERLLFNEANLVINNGEHVGIVGLNGAGKSTFINILAGKITWDSGEVRRLNGTRWGYLDQHATLDGNLTVMEYLQDSFRYLFEINEKLEEIYAAMGNVTDPAELDKLIRKSSGMQDELNEKNFYDLDSQIKKVANGLGINEVGYDKKISLLSGGQRAKLMLSKLILQDLDIMLLDEPTNFLDIEHIEWLTKYLNSFKKTFLVISHDVKFLNNVAQYIVNIENGTIKKFTGNYDKFLAQRDMIARQYEEDYERQQAEIKKMQDYIDRNKSRASTAGMANSRKKMLERINVMQKPAAVYDADFSFPYIELNSKDFLIVSNLVIGYDKPLLPPVSFHMSSKTKMWIRGTNGVGKTTLLKTLMRKIPAISGSFNFHIATKAAYVEQDLVFPNPDRSAVQYFQERFPKLNYKEVRSELAAVGLKGELASKPINNLSGGEQVRIKLACLNNTKSNLLILDEPTNHLDVRAKEKLKKAIAEYEGAVILVSHEESFAGELCDIIFDARSR